MAAAGLEALAGSWQPAADPGSDAAGLLATARSALAGMTRGPVSVKDNQVTPGGVQLRLDRDLLWYPYSLAQGQWESAGEPQADPGQAAGAL